MSDVHGAGTRFWNMLDKINVDFSIDTLIINGDIVDRNKDSLRLFYEIYDLQIKYGSDHVIILKGNHELFLSMYLRGKISKAVYSSDRYGGGDTIREVQNLSKDEGEKLVELLDSLPIYKKVYSEKRKEDIVVVHTGLDYMYIVTNTDGTINVIDSINDAMKSNEHDFLINTYMQRSPINEIISLLDMVMCIGHVPTCFISDIGKPVISICNRVILADCGAGYGQRLGCLRIEDEAVFYI